MDGVLNFMQAFRGASPHIVSSAIYFLPVVLSSRVLYWLCCMHWHNLVFFGESGAICRKKEGISQQASVHSWTSGHMQQVTRQKESESMAKWVTGGRAEQSEEKTGEYSHIKRYYIFILWLHKRAHHHEQNSMKYGKHFSIQKHVSSFYFTC